MANKAKLSDRDARRRIELCAAAIMTDLQPVSPDVCEARMAKMAEHETARYLADIEPAGAGVVYDGVRGLRWSAGQPDGLGRERHGACRAREALADALEAFVGGQWGFTSYDCHTCQVAVGPMDGLEAAAERAEGHDVRARAWGQA